MGSALLLFARQIPVWQSLGFQVSLYFLALDNAEIALARVAARVAQGGHAIPEATVRRRFESGLRNFDTLYKPLVDRWMLYDNSGIEPVLVDWGNK